MKLSEAIIEGSKKRPQVFNSLLGLCPDGTVGSCALGAAFEACDLFDESPEDALERAKSRWADEDEIYDYLEEDDFVASELENIELESPACITTKLTEEQVEMLRGMGGEADRRVENFLKFGDGITIEQAVPILNDGVRMSREAIADWLASNNLDPEFCSS